MSYFLVQSDEDGISVTQVTPEGLERWLGERQHYRTPPTFLKKLPDIDKGCFYRTADGAVFIIKGEIVVPEAVETVTRYKLP